MTPAEIHAAASPRTLTAARRIAAGLRDEGWPLEDRLYASEWWTQ